MFKISSGVIGLPVLDSRYARSLVTRLAWMLSNRSYFQAIRRAQILWLTLHTCYLPYQNIRSLVHICCKVAANLRHIVAASLPQTRFSYANYFSGALFAANLRHTVVAHIVCGSFSIHILLAHNVCHKFTAHSCHALFWHTMCATSLQRTVVAHCSGTQCAPQVYSTQLPCTALAHNMLNPLPTRPLVNTPPLDFMFRIRNVQDAEYTA